ncbi:hypothetical protein Ddye_007439 [Dipteronia dyeriana]|uniref:MATH domain-containing protein n=1 Tax=Dipteronia dyeriana TaxID=168575 RepID=A0AAD9XKF0_9ROSI|nr:hypothetical protein Ddye_007439 [Dipteronia dyeriana]
MLLRRNGQTSPGMDYGISVYLYMDPDAFTGNQKVLVNFTLRVQDQIFGNHIDYTADKLFPAPRDTMWGKENIIKMKDLTDPTKGFLVNGKFIVQAFVYDIGRSDYIGTTRDNENRLAM